MQMHFGGQKPDLSTPDHNGLITNLNHEHLKRSLTEEEWRIFCTEATIAFSDATKHIQGRNVILPDVSKVSKELSEKRSLNEGDRIKLTQFMLSWINNPDTRTTEAANDLPVNVIQTVV